MARMLRDPEDDRRYIPSDPEPDPEPPDDTPDDTPDDDVPHDDAPPPRRPSGRRIAEDPPPEDWPEWPEEPDDDDGSGHDTEFDRRTTVGATILGSVIGPVYGKRRVGSYCMFTYSLRSVWSDWWAMGFAFFVGESKSFLDLKINSGPAWPLVASGSLTFHLGTNTVANRSELFRYLEPSYFPGLGYAAMRMSKANMPGTLNVDALIEGKLIEDFRPGGPADDNFSNPALIAYDICRDKEMWKGLDVLEVNTDQLADIADWCDEQINGTERWHYHSRLDIRDTDAALAEVLAHCFTTPYVYDQKMYFVANMPPKALDDTWSNSGQTFNADTSSGNATAKLVSGSGVLIYESGSHTTYTVDDVVSNNQFSVVESVGSHTTVDIRPISKIQLHRDDYVKAPSGVDQDFAQIPDVVNVKYLRGDDGEWATTRCDDPDGYAPGDPRMREATLAGIKVADIAARWGHQNRRAWAFCPFEWNMEVGQVAAELAPGDVFRMDTEDGLDGALVRCLAKGESLTTGGFTIRAREFDMGVYSDDTADEDDDVTGENVVEPVAPTAVTQIIGEAGDWDTSTLISDPDDISGWTVDDSDLALSYDSGNDETDLELTGAHYDGDGDTGMHLSAYLDISSEVAAFGSVQFHFVIKWKANDQDSAGLRWSYAAGTAHAAYPTNIKNSAVVTPYADDGTYRYYRISARFNPTTDAYHELQFGFWNTEDPGASLPKIAIKRVRMVAWGEQGEAWSPIGTASPLWGLGLYQQWDWTEGVDAALYNASYEFYRDRGSGGAPVLIQSLPRSVTVNEAEIIRTTHPNTGDSLLWGLNAGGSSERRRSLYGVAVSTTGHRIEFPDATQSFLGDSAPPALQWWRTYFINKVWDQVNPPFYWENFEMFVPDDENDIDPAYWNDYEIELWVNKGDPPGAEQLILSNTWPGTVGWGDSPAYSGQSWFYKITVGQYNLWTYELWLRNKYTGKRTQMSEAGSTDGSGDNPPPGVWVNEPVTAKPGGGATEFVYSEDGDIVVSASYVWIET